VKRLALGAAGVSLALATAAGVALTTPAPGPAPAPAPAPAATPAPAPAPVPSEMPTRAEAERYYRTHLGPSAAWAHATPAARHAARAAYEWDYGTVETSGCEADVRHAYQGTKAHQEWRQPALRVEVVGHHTDTLFAEYVDGICGE
jgi:hypothetical protein